MFGIFTGAVANAALVILGSLIGCVCKTEKLRGIGDRVLQLFACFVLVLGISGAIALAHPIYTLVAIVAGTAVGELADLDLRFTQLGNWFERKMSRFTKGSDSGFAKSFISGVLLFCIGSMTIMGGIQSGIENVHTIYYTKGLIDAVSAATFAMSSGIGVAFASIPLLIYQGLLALLASLIGDFLLPETVAMSSQIGSLILIPLSLNLLGITNIKVANFIPAMFVPFVWQIVSSLI